MKNKSGYIIFYLFVFIFNYAVVGQNRGLDSLLNLIKTDKEDTNKVNHLYKVYSFYIRNGEYSEALPYFKRTLTLATEILKGVDKSINNPIYKSLQNRIALSYNGLGIIYYQQGNYPEALKNYYTSLRIREELKDKFGIGNSYSNIGLIYYNQGNYAEALKSHYESLKISESLNDKPGISTAFNNIGNIYAEQGNLSEALKNYLIELKINEEIGDDEGVANCYNNIGLIYFHQGNITEALKNQNAALKKRKEVGDKKGIAESYMGIGLIFHEQKNYSEALKNYFAAKSIVEELGDKVVALDAYVNISLTYISLNKIKDAYSYLSKALQISTELRSKKGFKGVYKSLVNLDSVSGNFKAAFEHHKLYISYRDSIDNEETQKKSLQASMQYEFDKKEMATKATQEKKDAVVLEEKQKQKIVISLVSFVLLLVIVFSVFLFNRFRITNRQKIIIEQQKVAVDKAYEELHEKNKEVMDSINYARRIQQALLPTNRYINKHVNRKI